MDYYSVEQLSQMGEMMQSLSPEAFEMQLAILKETSRRLPENSQEKYLLEMFLIYLQE
tara:strand:- start:352 stop:525 length:174 start_codon:yes stop_codon:yes gene_type:complete